MARCYDAQRFGSGDGEHKTTMNTTDAIRAVACIRFVRLVCTEWQCLWVGPESDALQAPDPFNSGATLLACPDCREQSLRMCCDEPECIDEATCGTPTLEGYRHTCGKHLPNVAGQATTRIETPDNQNDEK
jgi:hypothetical protein